MRYKLKTCLTLIPFQIDRLLESEEIGYLFYTLPTYVTGSGKRDIFAHIFKIELLAPQGRVSSQL